MEDLKAAIDELAEQLKRSLDEMPPEVLRAVVGTELEAETADGRFKIMMAVKAL